MTVLDSFAKKQIDDSFVDAYIAEGRRREREEIIQALMGMYNVDCCCDTASFGDHYLAHKQYDNLIDLINKRKID